MDTYSANVNGNLPQMKSIWIDEDEEAEKLYGLQAQQFMDSDSEEYLPSITIINSDKPILNNKTNIELPGFESSKCLNKNTPIKYNTVKNKKKSSHKKLFGKLFKNNTKDNSNVKKTAISTPFDFNHISHAGSTTGKNGTNETLDKELKLNQESFDPKPTKLKTLSKVFMTESIPQNVHNRGSCNSSVYSANSMKSGRIVSTSTMATTILDRSSQFKNNSINNTIDSRSNSKTMKLNIASIKEVESRPLSNNSSNSIQFLKDYNFPTLLEDTFVNNFTNTVKPTFVDTPKSVFTPTLAHQSPALSIHSKYSSIMATPIQHIKRRNSHSSPYSISTPELETMLFKDTPKSSKRVSLDDIYKYYNQSSVTESPSTSASPYI